MRSRYWVSGMSKFSELLLVLLIPLSALAQDTPQPQFQPQSGEPEKISGSSVSNPRQIMIEVQVNDKSGAPVRGLQKQDFTLLDDKRPQNILSFFTVDNGANSTMVPVEVDLVIDAVNASFQAVSAGRQWISKFLLRNGGKLEVPVSLLTFTDAGIDVLNPPSRDGKSLAALLDEKNTGLRLNHRSSGYWGASERFDLSMKAVDSLAASARTRPVRKLMIWISPGWPALSNPNYQLSNNVVQQLFNSIVATSSGLRQAARHLLQR